jgi:protoheme ferro-lyase
VNAGAGEDYQRDNSITRVSRQMTQAERDALKGRLDDFSRRLDAHVRDWKERGEFTDLHRNLIEEITQRHDQIQKKLALAEAHGTPWDVIKIETERDFSSLFDDLLQISERLDSDEKKGR